MGKEGETSNLYQVFRRSSLIFSLVPHSKQNTKTKNQPNNNKKPHKKSPKIPLKTHNKIN